mmetsp:Transcript_53431/g.125666  ORF Transcript_53431/g.125666 Transcript_53431/m.125666 type:complete len:150 (-) Transcript_53431:33-482(-)
MAQNFALESAGAQVTFTTSMDARHPPMNMITGDDSKFWVSTGLFPQEFIVGLASSVQLKKIKLLSTNIRSLEIQTCNDSARLWLVGAHALQAPIQFTTLETHELSDRSGRKQAESFTVKPVACRFLKFIVKSGWDDFISVYSVGAEGDV